ncbi:hypothetical protein D9Q98_005599 [Chlorella vulgaris]|uniref:Extracellular solute-binding protein n=1 Tax=Chlorella vulgaris TaxID=3077 RepID=A0A9D4TN04_CHLVU|nr:hypothetical protein D9Q98_005599 [Chlorella vulgaris]
MAAKSPAKKKVVARRPAAAAKAAPKSVTTSSKKLAKQRAGKRQAASKPVATAETVAAIVEEVAAPVPAKTPGSAKAKTPASGKKASAKKASAKKATPKAASTGKKAPAVAKTTATKAKPAAKKKRAAKLSTAAPAAAAPAPGAGAGRVVRDIIGACSQAVAALKRRMIAKADGGDAGSRSSPPSSAALPLSTAAAPSLPGEANPSSLPLNRRRLAAAAVSTVAAVAAGGLPVALMPAAQAAAAATESPPRDNVREIKMVMRVTALRGSVPQQWVADFQTALEGFGVVAMTLRPQPADIYAELVGNKATKGKPSTADAVTLGDTWLQRAIAEGLIQPIPNARQYRWWDSLYPRWQQLVCRDRKGLMDARGEVWAVPYRWGATLVAYRKDKLGRADSSGGVAIRDWADLLQPQLRGRVAFMDSPRDVVGVALKTLGLPFNASASDIRRCGLTEEDVRSRVQRLVKQVRVFSSTDHVRALGAGDVDAVVGWSDDLLPLVERTNNLEAAAPLSGTTLFADCWCIPTAAAGGAEDGEPSPLLPAWFEIGLQPVHAPRSKGLRSGASPLLLPGAPWRRGGAARNCSLLEPAEPPSGSSQLDRMMPSTEVLERSEFLLPLDAETSQLYRRLLQA